MLYLNSLRRPPATHNLQNQPFSQHDRSNDISVPISDGVAIEPGDSLPTAMAEHFNLAQHMMDDTKAEFTVKAKRAAP